MNAGHERDVAKGLARIKYSAAQATKAFMTIALFSVFAFCLGFIAWYYGVFKPYELKNAFAYAMARACDDIGCEDRKFSVSYQGKNFKTAAKDILVWEGTVAPARKFVRHLPFSSGAGLAFGFLVGFGLMRAARGRSQQDARRHLRGNEITKPSELASQIRRSNAASDLELGGVPLIKNTERQGFLAVGTVGSGKSTVIYKFLDRIEKRGEMAVVVDDNGEFVSRYYDPNRGDVILNPFDARSPRWSPWSEVTNGYRDCERLAAACIPPGEGKGKFFHDSARMVLTNLLLRIPTERTRSIEELTRQILTASREEKKRLLRGTPASQLFEKGNEGPGMSVDVTVQLYASKLAHLRADAGTRLESDFSITRFITSVDDRKGRQPWLFLSSKKADLATTRPLLTMWMESVALAILSMPKKRDRIIHIVADEFGQLMHIPSLPDLLAEGRGFGSAPKLGVQTPYQMISRYGDDAARTLMNVINTTVCFRMIESRGAEQMARMFGAAEIERDTRNTSFNGSDVQSTSLSMRRTIENTVLPSELLTLDDLECFIRLPGKWPVTKTRLVHPGKKMRKEQCAAFDVMPPGVSALDQVLGTMNEAPSSILSAAMTAGEEDAKTAVSMMASANASQPGRQTDTNEVDEMVASVTGFLSKRRAEALRAQPAQT